MCPSYDPDTGEVSAAAWAYDTHAITNDQPSIFDSISNVVTKGVPLTGLSIVNSFANTAIEVGNFFGADNKKLTIQDEVGDGDMNDYYKAHSQGIEAAGLLIGSLLPGLGAIKLGSIGVKAAWLAREGLSTEALSSATGLLAPIKAAKTQLALDEIMNTDAALFGSMAKSKTVGIALGVTDQALQGAVFSAATAATMHASPLLDDQTFPDAMQDVLWGGVFGGLIGGAIEGYGARALINKAINKADTATKGAEDTTRLGLGNYVAGDRAAVLLDALDTAKGPEGGYENLAQKKYALREGSDLLYLKKLINTPFTKGGLIEDADQTDVGGAVFDSILKARDAGTLDTYGTLGRLAKVSRYTGDDTGTIPTSDTFFINRFAPDKKPDEWSSLVTSVAHPDADTSIKYQFRTASNDVSIARFASTLEASKDVDGKLYDSAGAAWEAGHDMFIDKNLKIHVNPQSLNIERAANAGESRILSAKEEAVRQATGSLPAGSKPLYGAPVILNTKTGAITSTAKDTLVVGDFGKVESIGDYLHYGDNVSEQGIGKVLTKETPTIDASARYAWADARGVKAGDTIGVDDIPVLEALHNKATSTGDYQGFLNGLDKKNITFSDGTTPSQYTEESLLNTIKNAKDNLIHDLISENPKMGSDEVALRANVPDSYINNNLKGTQPEEYLRPITDHTDVVHAKLEYDIGSTSQQDGMILRGAMDTQYRVDIGRKAATDALASYAGKNYDQFIIEAQATDAKVTGTGAGAFSFANGDYNTLDQEVERVGRFGTKTALERGTKVADTLTSPANAMRQDPVAAAEWGIFTGVRQRTGEHFIFLPPQLAQKMVLDPNTAVLRKAVTFDKLDQPVSYDPTFTPTKDWINKTAGTGTKEDLAPGNYTSYLLNSKVADYERASASLNDSRLIDRNNWWAAQGINKRIPGGILYAPPIDTSKSPFFAYVRNIEGKGGADSGVAVITAKTQEELQTKISALRTDFSVYTKDQLADFHKAEGEYEYNRNFAQSSVNSALTRKGILNDIFPDTRAETLIKNSQDWHNKQEVLLMRDHIELGNGQLIAELRAMGERFQQSGTSETGYVSNFTRRTVQNPSDTYIKTMLGISPKDQNYPLWAWANEKLESTFDTAFRVARNTFIGTQKGVLSYEDAAKLTKQYGLGNPYEAAVDAMSAYYDIANRLPDKRILSTITSKANAVLGATVIKLDQWQQLMDAVTTPILMTAEANSAIRGLSKGSALEDQLTMAIPDGTGRRMPAVSKVIFDAVGDLFNPEIRGKWLPQLKELGIIRDNNLLDAHYQSINDLALPFGSLSSSKALDNIQSAVDFAAKYGTGFNLTQDTLHFTSAMIARRIFEGAGYEGKQLTDNIATFQNRVFGNFTASQRPVAFQGPIGQSIGLFQTYYFNLMQQIFRYVENGEGKTLGIMAGLQSTLFGFQGLPGFQFINNHLIGNAPGNSTHGDLYSANTSFFGKDLGNFLMYGGLSSVFGAGLYTRGDINPRSLTILPVNPLDFPNVAGAIKFAGTMWDTTQKIASGGNIPASLMIGLEHNGLSRPLAGLAQLMQGFSTTSSGDLVSLTHPGNNPMAFSDLFSAANYSRLLGSRPLDEAVAMDALYRGTLYKAKDLTRMSTLGEAVRSTLYNNGQPSSDKIQSFAKSYAASGGEIGKFGSAMMNWTQKANSSVANQVFRSLKQNGATKNMMLIMGGQPLSDNRLGAGSTAGSDTSQGQTLD